MRIGWLTLQEPPPERQCSLGTSNGLILLGMRDWDRKEGVGGQVLNSKYSHSVVGFNLCGLCGIIELETHQMTAYGFSLSFSVHAITYRAMR